MMSNAAKKFNTDPAISLSVQHFNSPTQLFSDYLDPAKFLDTSAKSFYMNIVLST
jgi:hypothetical protein